MEKKFVFKKLHRNRRGKLTKETRIVKKESELTRADLDLLYSDFKCQWDNLPTVIQHRFLMDAFVELNAAREKEYQDKLEHEGYVSVEKVTQEVESALGHA